MTRAVRKEPHIYNMKRRVSYTVVTRSRTSFAMDGPCSWSMRLRTCANAHLARASLRARAYLHPWHVLEGLRQLLCLAARPGYPPSIVVRCRWNSHVPSAVAGGRRWPCKCPSPSCGGPAHIRAGGKLVVSSGSIGCGGDVATTYSGYYAYAYYYYYYY